MSMLRLAQLSSQQAPRLTSRKQRQAAPAMTRRQLEQLGSACRRAQHCAAAAVAAASPKPIAPLPRPRILVTPFMHHGHGHGTRGMQSHASGLAAMHLPRSRVGSLPMPVAATPFTAAQELLRHSGLSAFLERVYLAGGGVFTATLGAAYAVSLSGLVGFSASAVLPAFPAMVAGALVALGGKWALRRTTPETTRTFELALITRTSIPRALGAGAFLSGLALSLTPIIQAINSHSPFLVPSVVGACALATAGTVWYSRRSARFPTKHARAQWKAPAFGALVGLSGLALVGGGSVLFLGSNTLAATTLGGAPAAAVVLFALYSTVEASVAAKQYVSEGRADHVGHVVAFYVHGSNFLSAVVKHLVRSQLPALLSRRPKPELLQSTA